MIFETAVQSVFLVPMAISLGYGILLATAVVLLFTPAVHCITFDVRHAIRCVRAFSRGEPIPDRAT